MIKIICVGKIKEKFYRDAIEEYSKRLSKYTKLEIIEVKDESKIFNIDEFNPSESMFIEASAGTGKTYTITEIVNKIVK